MAGDRDRQEDRGLPYLILDVFAEAPLQGNQLGVFTDAVGVGSEQMQRLARELNFSETVFLLPPERDGDARVRIFTPDHELPFAGHPVLGSAVAAGAARRSPAVLLETGLGLIPVDLQWQSSRLGFETRLLNLNLVRAGQNLQKSISTGVVRHLFARCRSVGIG